MTDFKSEQRRVLEKPIVQRDDGSRYALDTFMGDRDKNVAGMVNFCAENSQFWKGRVFLELLWEYERRLAQKKDE